MSVEYPEGLPPLRGDEFLPGMSSWTTLGGLIIVGGFGVAIAFIATVKYAVIVKAQGTIRPDGESRLVQAATAGTVTHLWVRENQPIKQGDLLATLEDSLLKTQKNQLQNQIQQVNLEISSINTQIQALDAQKVAENTQSDRAVASAQSELTRRQRQYQDSRKTSQSGVQEAQAQFSAAKDDWQRSQQELLASEAQLRSSQAALKATQSKRDRFFQAAQAGALSQDQLAEVQLAVEQQQQVFLAQQATVEAQKKTRERLHHEINVALAQLQQAQIALNPSSADMAIATDQIAQTTASGKAILANLARERTVLLQQQIKLQQQRLRDRSSLQQIERDLKQTQIRATVTGTITRLQLRNSGQTLAAGEKIAEIVPSHIPWVFSAMVAPEDRGKLTIGQSVQLRISACPYSDYGTLSGEVSQIPKDTVILGYKNGNDVLDRAESAFYSIKIKPDKLWLGKEPHLCSLQLGMEGRADITTQEETILQFLLRKARLITDGSISGLGSTTGNTFGKKLSLK